jgi:sec-independent protein translocase protein TatB
MFNVGGPEILVIFLVALIVLGPQQLPKAMRTFGNVMAEVRKVSNSFQAEVRNAMDTVVDTTATEKPVTATMAEAAPHPIDDTGTVLDSDAPEVVVRNDGEEPPPDIDPADRAAG